MDFKEQFEFDQRFYAAAKGAKSKKLVKEMMKWWKDESEKYNNR